MEFLKTVFGKNDKNNEELSIVNCPNCWGDQEYDNVIREKYEDKQIDVNNHSANCAFVQYFMITHISGIKQKSSYKGFKCPTIRTFL